MCFTTYCKNVSLCKLVCCEVLCATQFDEFFVRILITK